MRTSSFYECPKGHRTERKPGQLFVMCPSCIADLRSFLSSWVVQPPEPDSPLGRIRNHVRDLPPWGKLVTDQSATNVEENHVSHIEDLQLRVLDVLIEEHGYFTAPWGQVLVTLARRAFDDEGIQSQDREYQQTSMAVLRLEVVGFVSVDRAYRDEAQKANVITGIRLL